MDFKEVMSSIELAEHFLKCNRIGNSLTWFKNWTVTPSYLTANQARRAGLGPYKFRFPVRLGQYESIGFHLRCRSQNLIWILIVSQCDINSAILNMSSHREICRLEC